jgi:galactokinase
MFAANIVNKFIKVAFGTVLHDDIAIASKSHSYLIFLMENFQKFGTRVIDDSHWHCVEYFDAQTNSIDHLIEID